jgi:hypothetical protein
MRLSLTPYDLETLPSTPNFGPHRTTDTQALKEDAHEGYPYSYIQKHWDDMYLTIRCSHPVNVSPYFKLVDDPSKGQFRRAAEFALAYVRWTRKILAGALEPCPGGKGAYLCHSGYMPSTNPICLFVYAHLHAALHSNTTQPNPINHTPPCTEIH